MTVGWALAKSCPVRCRQWLPDLVGRVVSRDDIRYVSRGVFAVSQRSLTALSVTIDSILVQDEEPTAADLDGDVVILSPRAGSYFGFNRVATEIWHMLAEPCRVAQIFNALAESHDVDADTLARDVTPFLQTLVEHRLVRLIDPGEVR
jgi:Coenzyme PQQ synthesis protein D (PqqD)